MILLTGSGAIASAFQKRFACKIRSFRKLNDHEIKQELRGVSVVIHNAANVNPATLDEAIHDNADLTKRIADASFAVDPKMKFVFISSMSMLMTESTYLPDAEMTSYAKSKWMAEQYVLAINAVNFKSLRFSTIFYGDPLRDGLSKLIYDAVRTKQVTIIDEGIARRDFIPLEIAVRYLYEIAIGSTQKRIMNVASGKSVSFHEVVCILKELIPDLKINSTVSAGARNILSDFNDETLRPPVVIDFTLRDYVITEIKRYSA